MKIIVTESRKISKDYNSTQLGYTIEVEVPDNNAQEKINQIEKFISSQFARRSAESEAKAVFVGAKDSGTPPTPNRQPTAPQTVVPRTNGNTPSTNQEWNVVSQKQLGFLYFTAKDQGKDHELKNLYKDMGIITTKDKNNMSKDQLKEIKAWLGIK